MTYSKRKLILLSITIAMIHVAFFVYYISSSGILHSEKYTVRIRLGSLVHTKYQPSIYEHGAIVVFIRNNNTVGEYSIGFTKWKNITLHKGAYLIKLYVASSAIFIKEIQIYVTKDIDIEINAVP